MTICPHCKTPTNQVSTDAQHKAERSAGVSEDKKNSDQGRSASQEIDITLEDLNVEIYSDDGSHRVGGTPQATRSHEVVISLDCAKCGASLQVAENSSTYTCKYCRTVHERDYSRGATPTPHSLQVMADRSLTRKEYGKAMQFIEQGLAIDPHHIRLLELETKVRAQLDLIAESTQGLTSVEIESAKKLGEARGYYLQAQFIHNSLAANIQVYGSNNLSSSPANVDLALQYLDRCLELFPDEPWYLALKGIFLFQGKGDKQSIESAFKLLKKAHQIDPRDINIQSWMDSCKAHLPPSPEARPEPSSCFIATAAFGSPLADEVNVLRIWRDKSLNATRLGKCLVFAYCAVSPPIAVYISTRKTEKRIVRFLLKPLVKYAASRYP